MQTVLYLNNKLKESWTGIKFDKKNNTPKENLNLKSLNKIGINNIEDYYELIIKKINSVNSKYNVKKIKFVDNPIPFIKKRAINAGAIGVEDDNGISLLAYVFISNPHLGSRDIFGSQQLFPGLSYLIDHFLPYHIYELTNLPVYFINGSTDNLVQSMRENIIAMDSMGIRYLQLFNEEALSDKLFNADLFTYTKYITKDKDLITSESYTNNYYIINKYKKEIMFTTDSFNIKKLDKFGSSGRFFVIKAYPALIMSDELGYKVNISKIDDFLSKYKLGSTNLSPFIKYANKLIERERF